jgi:hypothetical protein
MTTWDSVATATKVTKLAHLLVVHTLDKSRLSSGAKYKWEKVTIHQLRLLHWHHLHTLDVSNGVGGYSPNDLLYYR